MIAFLNTDQVTTLEQDAKIFESILLNCGLQKQGLDFYINKSKLFTITNNQVSNHDGNSSTPTFFNDQIPVRMRVSDDEAKTSHKTFNLQETRSFVKTLMKLNKPGKIGQSQIKQFSATNRDNVNLKAVDEVVLNLMDPYDEMTITTIEQFEMKYTNYPKDVETLKKNRKEAEVQFESIDGSILIEITNTPHDISENPEMKSSINVFYMKNVDNTDYSGGRKSKHFASNCPYEKRLKKDLMSLARSRKLVVTSKMTKNEIISQLRKKSVHVK